MQFSRGGVALLVLVVVAATSGPSLSAPPVYRVIVNSGHPGDSVERKLLADAFLKRTTRWSHGEGIRPVDLGADSPVRRRFSEEVLGRSVGAVKSYWQQLIFSGRGVPPPELEVEDEVVKFVLKTRGAIGYVSTAIDVAGVKVVSLR